MNDPDPDVRRDACRRVLESATNARDPYTKALGPLKSKLRELVSSDERNADVVPAALLRLEELIP